MFTAALVGAAEFAGGISVISGVAARFGAGCLVIVMFGAIVLVHLPHGYDTTKGGFEYPLTLLLLAVAVVIAGAGHYTAMHAAPDGDGL